MRNRVSAQQARERKKAYLIDLEARVKELETKNAELEERLSTLQNENQMLRQVAFSEWYYPWCHHFKNFVIHLILTISLVILVPIDHRGIILRYISGHTCVLVFPRKAHNSYICLSIRMKMLP